MAALLVALAPLGLAQQPAVAGDLGQVRAALSTEEASLERVAVTLQARTQQQAEAKARLAGLERARRTAAARLATATGDWEEAQQAAERAHARVVGHKRQLAEAEAELAEWRRRLSLEARESYKYGAVASGATAAALLTVSTSRSPSELTHTIFQLERVLVNRVDLIDETIRLIDRTRVLEDLAAQWAEHRQHVLQVAEEALQTTEYDHRRRLEAAGEGRQDLERLDLEVERLSAQHEQLAQRVAARQREYDDLLATLPRGTARFPGESFERSFVCPAPGERNFVNDWGFPRPGGRRHQGTDVFQPYGAPVAAIADAVVTGISRTDSGLGGITVTYSVDGYSVYNAHLSAVAPELGVHDRVYQGEVIGAVGTSGNARGTPPHNHLGLYSPGGGAVNPYPLLAAVC